MNGPWYIDCFVLVKKFIIYLDFAAARLHWAINSHQIIQHLAGSLGILSIHQIQKFVFPHIWHFPDCALFLCDYIYQTQESTFFVLSRPSVQWFWFIIFTTVSSLRAPGRDAGIATIYGADCWRKMYALFDFPLPNTWFLFPPILASAILSIIYHLLKCIHLLGRDVWKRGWI